MTISTLFITVLTSGSVSALLVFFLKTYFKARIEQRYRLEIEHIKREHEYRITLLKSQLEANREGLAHIARRRNECYPKLAELASRLVKIGKDLAIGVSEGKLSLVSELASRTEEMEELLYVFRIDLVRDGLFGKVHSFKNLAINYCFKVSDTKLFVERGEMSRANEMQEDVIQAYSCLADAHRPLILALSAAEQTNVEAQQHNRADA